MITPDCELALFLRDSCDSPMRESERDINWFFTHNDGKLAFALSRYPGGTLTLNVFSISYDLNNPRFAWIARAHVGPADRSTCIFPIVRICANFSDSEKEAPRHQDFKAVSHVQVYEVDVEANHRNLGYGKIVVSSAIEYYSSKICRVERVTIGVESLTPRVALSCYRSALKFLGFEQDGYVQCTYFKFDPDVDEFDVISMTAAEYEENEESSTGSKWTGEIYFRRIPINSNTLSCPESLS